MKIRSGSKNVGQSFEIELTDADVIIESGIDAWNKLSLGEKYRAMARLADLMVVDYMRENDWITTDYAVQRTKEINSRWQQ